MAKSQTNAATGASSNLISQAERLMPPVVSGLQSQAANAATTAGTTEGLSQSGYTNQQTTGGYDPTQLANLRAMFSGMLPTGGYDPTTLANLQGSLGGMEATGGMDPTELANITGGYDTMASTGGFTEADKQRYLAQATRGTTTTASNLAAAAARNAAATGGNAGAAIADIQRSAGQQQADATNAGLTSLNQQINANKLAGLGGGAGVQQNLAAARQGVAGLESGLAGGVAAGRQGIAGQQAGLESGVASGVNAANAGLAGLYGTAAGQQTALNSEALQGLGLMFGTEAQGASILQALSQNPGLFQTAFGDVNALLGTLAKFKS